MRWNAIYNRIKDIYYPVGVEIGVYQGELSKNILSLHPGLKWIMIDAWSQNTYEGKDDSAVSPIWRERYENNAEENFQQAYANVEKYGDRASLLRLNSIEASKLFSDNTLDIVFADASHDYKSISSDSIAWWPKIKKGGYMCGHDYEVPEFPDIKSAVHNIFKGYSIELDEDFTWFVRKI
jgi:hypothetical protein